MRLLVYVSCELVIYNNLLIRQWLILWIYSYIYIIYKDYFTYKSDIKYHIKYQKAWKSWRINKVIISFRIFILIFKILITRITIKGISTTSSINILSFLHYYYYFEQYLGSSIRKYILNFENLTNESMFAGLIPFRFGVWWYVLHFGSIIKTKISQISLPDME